MGISEINTSNVDLNFFLGGAEAAPKANQINGLYDVVSYSNSDLVEFSNMANSTNEAKNAVLDNMDNISAQGGENQEVKKTRVEELREQLNEINETIEKLKDNIEASEDKIEKANATIARLNHSLKIEKQKYERLEAQEQKLISEFEEKQTTVEENQDDLSSTSRQLEIESEDYVADIENQRYLFLSKIQNEYNEEKHGDYNSYINKKLGEFKPDTSGVSVLYGLASSATSLEKVLKNNTNVLGKIDEGIENITCKLNESAMKIASYNDEITTQKHIIKVEKLNIYGFREQLDVKMQEKKPIARELYVREKLIRASKNWEGDHTRKANKVDWKKVEENNIDLSEKMEDGSSRYLSIPVFGSNQYRIYDMKYCLPLSRVHSQDFQENHKADFKIGFGPDFAHMFGQFFRPGGRPHGLEFEQGLVAYRGHRPRPDFGYRMQPHMGHRPRPDFGHRPRPDFGHGPRPDFGNKANHFGYNGPLTINDDGQLVPEVPSYNTHAPLVFDLEGDGIKTGELISYDTDGDGTSEVMNDVQDGIIVFDKDGNGISGENGTEVFGSHTDLDNDGQADGFKDGFEALKAFAQNHGLISEDDNILDEKDLEFLNEQGLKIKTGGYNSEAQSLLDLGITEISLSDNEIETIDNFDDNYNQLNLQSGANFKINGEEREYAAISQMTTGENPNKFEPSLKDNTKYSQTHEKLSTENINIIGESENAIAKMKRMIKEVQ